MQSKSVTPEMTKIHCNTPKEPLSLSLTKNLRRYRKDVINGRYQVYQTHV